MYVITPNELWILYNKKNNLCKDMKLVEYCRNLEILNKLLGIMAYMTYHKLLVNLRWWTVMSRLWVLSLEVLQGEMKILVKFTLKENFVKILLRKKKEMKENKTFMGWKIMNVYVMYIIFYIGIDLKCLKVLQKKTSFYTCRLIRSVKITWRILERYSQTRIKFFKSCNFRSTMLLIC